eukprot:8007150-Alexandrium_andersonii.AAC.1
MKSNASPTCGTPAQTPSAGGPRRSGPGAPGWPSADLTARSAARVSCMSRMRSSRVDGAACANGLGHTNLRASLHRERTQP